MMTETAAELGPLPEPSGELWELKTRRGDPPFRYFSAEDMRAYAAQERAAEREACAQVCDALTIEIIDGKWSALGAVEDCADTIRERSNAAVERPAD